MTREDVGKILTVIDVQYFRYLGLYRGLYSRVGHLSIAAVLSRVLQAIRKTNSSRSLK